MTKTMVFLRINNKMELKHKSIINEGGKEYLEKNKSRVLDLFGRSIIKTYINFGVC